MVNFQVKFTEQDCSFITSFVEQDCSFVISFGEMTFVQQDVLIYEGDYSVTPTVSSQTLQTAQKLMREDLTIKEIPYFVVSNASGGDTVYIAKEVD